MTEDEAKQKICPVRYVGIEYKDNDSPASHGAIYSKKCIGQECMAWRWINPPYVPCVVNGVEYKAVVDGIDLSKATPVGFCGLAGKP